MSPTSENTTQMYDENSKIFIAPKLIYDFQLMYFDNKIAILNAFLGLFQYAINTYIVLYGHIALCPMDITKCQNNETLAYIYISHMFVFLLS